MNRFIIGCFWSDGLLDAQTLSMGQGRTRCFLLQFRLPSSWRQTTTKTASHCLRYDLVLWSNRSISNSQPVKSLVKQRRKDTTRWVLRAPCIVNEIVSCVSFWSGTILWPPLCFAFVNRTGYNGLKIRSDFWRLFTRKRHTKDTSARFTSRRSVIVYSSS